jgi:hypothetical protein
MPVTRQNPRNQRGYVRSSEVLDHPGGRRSAGHENDVVLARHPGVPEMFQRGAELCASRVEPRQFVEEDDSLRAPSRGLGRFQEPFELCECLLPRTGHPARSAEAHGLAQCLGKVLDTLRRLFWLDSRNYIQPKHALDSLFWPYCAPVPGLCGTFFSRPFADFTDGDLANPSRKRAGMRKNRRADARRSPLGMQLGGRMGQSAAVCYIERLALAGSGERCGDSSRSF